MGGTKSAGERERGGGGGSERVAVWSCFHVGLSITTDLGIQCTESETQNRARVGGGARRGGKGGGGGDRDSFHLRDADSRIVESDYRSGEQVQTTVKIPPPADFFSDAFTSQFKG